jgi:hypothetical protein
MTRLTKALCIGLAMIGTGLRAQDTSGHLSVELNAAQDQEGACKLSFLVQNSHAADVEKAVFETVIFDAEGQVNRLTLFDFGLLPAGRPRVRQFVIPGTPCDQIGRILFNGAKTCDGAGLPASACSSGLGLTTRTGIEVLG